MTDKMRNALHASLLPCAMQAFCVWTAIKSKTAHHWDTAVMPNQRCSKYQFTHLITVHIQVWICFYQINIFGFTMRMICTLPCILDSMTSTRSCWIGLAFFLDKNKGPFTPSKWIYYPYCNISCTFQIQMRKVSHKLNRIHWQNKAGLTCSRVITRYHLYMNKNYL